MKRFTTYTLAAALLGGSAFAGTLEDPAVETPPAPVTATPAPLGGDWTGPYVGLSFGRLSADAGPFEEDGNIYGLFGGYDYDFGQFVLGGELDFQSADDFTLGGVDFDNILRLKARGGFDAGPALFYGTAGWAQADTSIGDSDGAVYGLGMDYKITDRFTVGLEYLRHDFNDFAGTGVDVNADTISLRGALRF